MESWSGSEKQRRPQGICRAPVNEPSGKPRFLVRTGTYAYVRKIGTYKWNHTITKHDNEFHQEEERSGPYYVFRNHGFQLRVLKRRVIDRNKL